MGVFNCLTFTMLLLLLLLFSSTSSFAALPKLHPDEVKALKEIAKKLGKKDWEFNKEPCSGQGNWNISEVRKGLESSVSCDCSFNHNSTCHLIRLALKSQNLTGTVPAKIAKLRYLKELDLSRNLLTGSVPSQWATMRLIDLSLMGNKLSGPFPTVLTNITTLTNFSIEGNSFTGPVPPEFGRLINLQKVILSSNALTGNLPAELGNLVNLIDMRISDNNFSGKIPQFIGKWTQVQKLHIEGCSLEGPIPSSISNLTNLTDLRISELKGRGFGFPPLRKMDSMKTLVLRKCSINGPIPEYVGDMKKLKILDLSFNNLTGEIPDSFVKLTKVNFMYLNDNQLTGVVPAYLLESNKNVDLSVNNFTWDSSSPNECSRGSVNLVESHSSSKNKLNKAQPCLKHHFPCSVPSRQQRYSLHINCGGGEVKIGNTTYEADLEPRGSSMFYSGTNWAFSSTGNFMDNDMDSDSYIATNTSSISNLSGPDSTLYRKARLSPISLTYYGLCLLNGNYTVKLHFAEIIFINDNSFYSLGRRIFDVYIQDKLALKDFNIEKEADGTDKPIIKNFTVPVTGNTLKIQLYWAGRGTTGIPYRGSYGPLISAISVDPNFKPPSIVNKKERIVLIAGIVVVGAFLAFLVVVGIMWKKGCLGNKITQDEELRGLDLQTGLFTIRQIKAATDNFDESNIIGQGGFGTVYKGVLSEGTIIAVKQLSSKSKQGNREFVNEIGMISTLQHPNLVKLYGCCVDGNQLILIYEYMENNCLSRALFGKNENFKFKLEWPTRWKICLGIAKGLAYLHEGSRIKIVHRDIKTSNVLLDKDLNAKIADFGLARLNEVDKTHISTRIAGTIGYMAPEYAMRGYLTEKADVYSFGVVALEIVSGKSNTNYRPEDFVYLLDWAYVLQERGCLLELVDPKLGSEYTSDEAMVMLNIALMCTNVSPTLRPTMTQVVSMLEGRTVIQELLSDPGFSAINPKFKALRNHFWQLPSRTLSLSTNGPYTDSSSTKTEQEEMGILMRGSSLDSDEEEVISHV